MSFLEIVESSKQLLLFGIPMQDLGVLATLLVISYTFKQVKLLSEANTLPLMPLLIFDFDSSYTRDTKIYLRNIGVGPAFNVRVEKWELIFTDQPMVWNLQLILKPYNYLAAGEKRELLAIDAKGKETKSNIMKDLFYNSEQAITLPIKYNDMRGKEYFMLHTSKDGLHKITGHPRKLTSIWKVRLWWEYTLKANVRRRYIQRKL